MHASGAADACTGRGVSWAVACASAAGRFSGSVGGSPAECCSCSVQVGARYPILILQSTAYFKTHGRSRTVTDPNTSFTHAPARMTPIPTWWAPAFHLSFLICLPVPSSVCSSLYLTLTVSNHIFLFLVY